MIKWIFISVLAIIILGYMGIDIKQAIHSPQTQSNLSYIKEVSVFVWGKYLKAPVVFIWNEVVIKFIIDPLISIFKNKVKEKLNVKTMTFFSYSNRVII